MLMKPLLREAHPWTLWPAMPPELDDGFPLRARASVTAADDAPGFELHRDLAAD